MDRSRFKGAYNLFMKHDQEDVSEEPANQSDDVAGDQSDDANDKDEPAEKRGERPGNLRRRSEWFEKRHGGG